MNDFPDFASVRSKIGGIKGVMTRLGDAPAQEHKWKSMPKCPFCAQAGAGVFTKGAADFFKCHHIPCSSGNAVLSEVSYIAMREGLSEAKQVGGGPSPAYRRLLDLAGMWVEPPGKAPSTKHQAPERGNSQEPIGAGKETEATEGTPPMADLKSPISDAEKPPLQLEADADLSAPGMSDDELLRECIEVIRQENKASASALQRRLRIGYARAWRMMDILQQRGIVSGVVEGVRKILKLPQVEGAVDEMEKTGPPVPMPPAADDSVAKIIIDGKVVHEFPKDAKAPDGESEKREGGKSGPEKEKPELGITVTRWFYEQLFPTTTQMSACLPDGSAIPDPLPASVARKLKFRPVSLLEKRGVTAVSCQALGLRANPTSNEALLQDAGQKFTWEENRASGLWLEGKRKGKGGAMGRRPNQQFHGKGQIGRKPEGERKGKDDKWVWGYGMPVIIPYFNDRGELVKLRPHKGGAPKGTVSGKPVIYVPRDFARMKAAGEKWKEKFYQVIICEGEFKAMVLWQQVGAGMELQQAGDDDGAQFDSLNFEPTGVCALPGISYVQNIEMMADLEYWLTAVGARRIIVAFDDEDKSDRPMAMRFDAQACAQYLEAELSTRLHADARVAVLPRAWRNSNGKADWDGAAALMLRAEAPKSKDQAPEKKQDPI